MERCWRSVRDTLLFHHHRGCGEHSKGEHLPLLARFVDEPHNLREECVGSLLFETNIKILAMKFHNTITKKWRLNVDGALSWPGLHCIQ
jgi:hypothetical protein